MSNVCSQTKSRTQYNKRAVRQLVGRVLGSHVVVGQRQKLKTLLMHQDQWTDAQ